MGLRPVLTQTGEPAWFAMTAWEAVFCLQQPCSRLLLTRPRNGDDEFAVFFGDKVFALAG